MVGDNNKIETFDIDPKVSDFFKKNKDTIIELLILFSVLLLCLFSFNLGKITGMHEMCGDLDLLYNEQEEYYYCDNITRINQENQELYNTNNYYNETFLYD